MIISLDAKISFEKNPTPLYDKSVGGLRDIWDIPKHNKVNLWQAYKHIKLWR